MQWSELQDEEVLEVDDGGPTPLRFYSRDFNYAVRRLGDGLPPRMPYNGDERDAPWNAMRHIAEGQSIEYGHLRFFGHDADYLISDHHNNLFE